MKTLSALVFFGISASALASPFSGVVRSAPPTHSFAQSGWRIVEVPGQASDDQFLFYSKSSHDKAVASWSGTARKDETSAIKQWVLSNAPGIPKGLASCFAWHVTVERSQL